MPRRMFHDFEWFSELDVTKVGVSRVAQHHSTEALMCAWAVDDGPIKQWVPEEGEPMPAELEDLIYDERVLKQSWNKPAEYYTWKYVLGIEIPHAQWRDTMVLALSLSLPGKLSKAGTVVGLPADQQKDRRGTQLISIFSKLNKPTRARPFTRRSYLSDPVEWEEFKAYNRQDVEAERGVYRRIKRFDMPAHEWDLFALDQEINEAGLPINMAVVDNALEITAGVIGQRLHEMAEITRLKNPNSTVQLLPWLRRQGYPFHDLKKGHVEKALKDAEAELTDELAIIESEDYRKVLARRLEVSKASVKKYAALKAATDEDHLLRQTLQFAGAGRTWRWAGRKYQAQNLARPAAWLEKNQEEAVRHLEVLDHWSIEQLYSRDALLMADRRSPMDLLSTCVRPVVQAPPGKILVDADLNAIENRVLGWLARDKKIMRVFELDRDPYIDFATYMFHQPYDTLYAEYKAGDKVKRTTAKPGVLGCGYMLGPGAEFENPDTGETEGTGLLGYAWNMGVKLTLAQAQLSVKVWRETYEDAVNFWYEIERAMRRCITTGQPQVCDRIRFDMQKPWLRMILPSGRALHYCRPRVEMKMKSWGQEKATITYEGLDDKNQWRRLDTHPGKITENADQAVARDLLAHGLMLAKKRGIDVRLHVHDQVVGLAPLAHGDRDLRILMDCMETRPKWALDLPLKTEGATSLIFVKD
jgi:DNA polymerase